MIYVASPYSDPEYKRRVVRARKVQQFCAHLFNQGEHPFSPIAHWHDIACLFDMRTDARHFEAYNYDMFKRCDKMYVLMSTGSTKSLGLNMEIEWARRLGKPIHYFHDQDGYPLDKIEPGAG